MPHRSWQRALIALVLTASLLGIATWGTAHATLHWSDHGTTATDCAVCQAVKSGAAKALAAPLAQQLQPPSEPCTPACEVSEHADANLAVLAARAPPAA
jgi:hypothetical protein